MQIERKIPNVIERHLIGGAILSLLALLYTPLIVYWCDGWLQKNISIEHEYFSHGMIGLPFAAYISWTNRKQWRRLPDAAHPLGAVLLLIGAVFYLSGLSEWVNLSFPLVLAGICLWFKGIPGLRLQGFPLLLVFLATPNPIPYLITPLTLPLQCFIASTAGFILNQFMQEVTVEGSILLVGGQTVEVAPYCAGLKMLFTSLYVGLMLLYWTGALSSRTKTILFLTSAVVVSVSANIVRNTLLTYFHGSRNEGAFAWLHEGWGGDLYSTCMLGLLVVVLNRIEYFFTEVPEQS